MDTWKNVKKIINKWMEEKIIAKLTLCGIHKMPVSIPEISLDKIYELYTFHTFTEPRTDTEMLYFAFYYNTKYSHRGEKNYDKIRMIYFYERAAALNNIFALYYLGRIYKQNGNTKLMLKYFLEASELGYNKATLKLAKYYQKLDDYENMLKYFLSAIDKGHATSMFYLALYYQTNENYELWIKYCLMAFENGKHYAILHIIHFYQQNNDIDNVIKYSKMAAEKGSMMAIEDLGNYYCKHGNYELACKYFLMTLNDQNYYIIKYSYNSDTVYFFRDEENKKLMFEYVSRNLNDDNIKNVLYLVKFYDEIGERENVINYLLLAIDKGYVEAMDALGCYYEKYGKLDLVNKYFLMAINKKSFIAMKNKGIIHFNNRETDEAIKFFLMAANAGCEIAMYYLARCYSIVQKPGESLKYYIMAAEHGNLEAMRILAGHYHDHNDLKKTTKYCGMAIQQGCVNSMNMLAILHYIKLKFGKNEIKNGIKGEIRNEQYKLFKKLFLMASDKKNLNAKLNLASVFYAEEKYELMIKYYMSALKNETKDNSAISLYANNNLIKFYSSKIDSSFFDYVNIYVPYVQTNLPSLFGLIKNMYNEKILLLKNHFSFCLNGPKYNETKKKFHMRRENMSESEKSKKSKII